MRNYNSLKYGLLLNLLLPGLGHLYFRDYFFGIFILLVWIIASVLFYVSFLIDLPLFARIVLFGLPILFYFFTFIDLSKSIRKKTGLKLKSTISATIVLGVAIIYQLLSPTAPTNFLIYNGPSIFKLNNNRLSPVYQQGTLMKSSSLAYKISILGLEKPILHSLPQRYDIVRCKLLSGATTNAVVLGLPNENIEVIEGTLIIDGMPDFEGWIGGLTFSGFVEPTMVGEFSILVAELSLGAIDRTFQVPLSKVEGKVNRLLN